MADIRGRFRRFVEAIVPWFDRGQFELERDAMRRERDESKAVRARATETIQASYREYAQRVRR